MKNSTIPFALTITQKIKICSTDKGFNLINYSYEQLSNYYSNFKSDNKYIKYMTETDLIKQKIEINMLKVKYSDEFKLDKSQISELKEEACKDTDKLKKGYVK